MKPLTMAQARRRHATRACIAALSCAYFVAAALVCVALQEFAIAALAGLAALWFGRSATHRWARARAMRPIARPAPRYPFGTPAHVDSWARASARHLLAKGG